MSKSLDKLLAEDSIIEWSKEIIITIGCNNKNE
jgi:hypothetical protein